MRRKTIMDLLRSEKGASFIEMTAVVPFLVILLLGALDGGQAYFYASELANGTQAGAKYALLNAAGIASYTTTITNAVANGAHDLSGLTVATPVWGCECPDGSSYSASCASAPSSCASTWVYKVTITASVTYTPWFPLPGFPSPITLSNSATMRTGGLR